jgi:hypothetical protein
MKADKHDTNIPSSVIAQAQELINQANILLEPYATPLTPVERQTMPKMGEKSFGFVEKSYEFAVQCPNIRPPYLDMEAFGIDYNDSHNLWTLNLSAQQLHQNIDDTQMTAGSEAFQAALVFYNSAKAAMKQDVPGAKAVYEELRKRFPGGKRKNSDLE